MDVEQGLKLGDLGGMLRRRAGVIAIAFGAIVLLTIFVAAVLPNWYEASATILVQPQEISQKLVQSGLPDEDLNNRLHIIQMEILSRSRLSRVIDDLHLYPEESKTMTREEIIDMMRDRIDLEPILPELDQPLLNRSRNLQINTFSLSFQDRSPKVAAAVANRLANDFIDEHIRERTQVAGGTSEFMQTRLADLSKQMTALDQTIAKIKSENSGSLPEDLNANQQLESRLMDRLRDARQDLALAESDEAFYREQVVTGASTTDQYGPPDSPQRQLDALKVQLSQYLSRGYTEKHPDIIATRQQIADLQKQIAEGGKTGSGSSLSIAQQTAKAEQQRAALRGDAARKEVAQISKQLDDLEKRIAKTPDVAERLASYERQHDALMATYQDLSNKREEAGVAADMERRQKGEQFKLLEAAVPPPEASSPNRKIVVFLGVFLGLGFGLAAGLVSETMDDSYHVSEALQQDHGIPVLASIPTVLLSSDLAARRRRRVRNAVAAVAVTGFVLVASVAGNWWVNGGPGFFRSSTPAASAQSGSAGGAGQ